MRKGKNRNEEKTLQFQIEIKRFQLSFIFTETPPPIWTNRIAYTHARATIILLTFNHLTAIQIKIASVPVCICTKIEGKKHSHRRNRIEEKCFSFIAWNGILYGRCEYIALEFVMSDEIRRRFTFVRHTLMHAHTYYTPTKLIFTSFPIVIYIMRSHTTSRV